MDVNLSGGLVGWIHAGPGRDKPRSGEPVVIRCQPGGKDVVTFGYYDGATVDWLFYDPATRSLVRAEPQHRLTGWRPLTDD